MTQYVIVRVKYPNQNNRFCQLGLRESKARFFGGKSLAPWPEQAVFVMDQRYKKKPKKSQIFGDVLSDFLSNTDDLLVVSARVRTTFEQAGHSGIEFLPAKITNWQDELVSEPYWIVNFLNPLDCLDVGASKTPDTATRARYEANGLALPAPGTQWWQLVIDQKRIDPTLQIFQIAGTRLTCVRDDFWEKLREYPNLEQVENASDVIVDI